MVWSGREAPGPELCADCAEGQQEHCGLYMQGAIQCCAPFGSCASEEVVVCTSSGEVENVEGFMHVIDEEEDVPLLSCTRGLVTIADYVTELQPEEDGVDAFPLPHPATSSMPPDGFTATVATQSVTFTAVVPADGSPILVEIQDFKLEVKAPPESRPGERVTFDLSAPPKYQVKVPPGFSSGGCIRYLDSQGRSVQFQIPAGKVPGDSFTVLPTCMVVLVPPSVQAGEFLAFKGQGNWKDSWLAVMVPPEIAPGGHFPVRLPPKEKRTGTLTNKDLNAISIFGFKV
ncbi:hypothetical protein AK812_SmicGene7833 [Symbiodinium microadriaticum]|uniref:Uncharacterized protein n=1 Tax=Symbiodinium microadriaticum TaxID=2951 RepID=A0A1Q9EMN7_SYMMI|nr:hypothetical protein AK812_SmicGene7833 [Symbiodinium microadriaticum]CAE7824872.1 unnamed protein product [Symbiodinium microadriaticum]CAE7925974.1 unnamed protein product [Symbiodinium sp. KB8]